MGEISAGVAKVNITPPPVGMPLAGYSARKNGVGPSQGVHDELYAKALVLSDEEQKIAIVATDLIGVDLELTNTVREFTEKETGIPKENVLIAASHTHSGPMVSAFNKINFPIPEIYEREVENYRYALKRKIVGAIYIANKNLRSAKIGVGKGKIFTIGANRRDPNGPMDPEVGVLRVDDKAGNLIGALVNYTCHPTVMGANNLLISADFPGYAMSLVEKAKGAIALFTNGAEGNISTRFTRRGQTFKEVERFGTILGAEVLKVLEQITTSGQAEIKAAVEKVHLPFRKLPALEEAKRIVEESKQRLEKLRKEGAPRPYVRVAETTLQGAEATLRMVKTLKGEGIVSEMQVIRIDDTALVGVPVELFVEIGLEFKKKSGLKNAYIVGLANDYVGYVVTRKAYEEGMYESLYTRLSPAGEEIILDTALRLIEKTV